MSEKKNVKRLIGSYRKSTVNSQTLLRSTLSALKVMSLGSDTLPRIERNEECNHSCIIFHYSGCKAIWDWFILLLVMYTAIVTPYVVTFLSSSESCIIPNQSLKIIDVVVDVMFVADILINFRTTYVNSKDDVVTDSCKIAVNYLKGWFVLDFLAAFPFQYICIVSKINQITLINLVKSARLLRLVKVARKIDMYSEYNMALLLLLVFGFALVAHWLACIWYAIGVREYRTKNSLSWLTKLSNDLKVINKTENNPDLQTKYLTALYFTLSSMTSVGFGNVSANTNAEKIFAILIMVVGALMYAVIFGNITAVIQRLYSGIAHYQSTMRKVRQFIRFYQIPSPLRQRLEDYSQYNYSYTNGIDMNEVLGHFPEGLQADICLHLNRNLFSRSSGFRNLSPGCLRSLSLKLKTTRYTPDNYIIHYGDEIVNLMWIERGTLEVVKGDRVLYVLGIGDSFGENFGKVHDRLIGKSCASVRAQTYCDIQYISRDDLLSIMRAYPEFHKKFNINFQLTFNLRDLELEEKDLSSSLCNLNQQRNHVLEKLKRKNLFFEKKEENINNGDSVIKRKFIASNLASALNLFHGHSIFVTDHSANQEKQNEPQQEDLHQSICEMKQEIDHIRKSIESFDKMREDVNSIIKLLTNKS